VKALVDIPDHQLAGLSEICAQRKLSRAEAVRQALDAFIAQNRPGRASAFGLWTGRPAQAGMHGEPLPEDGLAYQERLRGEW
jgi:hypothetical protein